MREEQIYDTLLQLIAQGAVLEQQTREGQRFLLRFEREHMPVPGALALKLVREGHVREGCKMSGRTLWFGV